MNLIGKYTKDNSDLLIDLISAEKISDDIYRVHLRLTNKNNGIYYEDKIYSLNINIISSWKRLE